MSTPDVTTARVSGWIALSGCIRPRLWTAALFDQSTEWLIGTGLGATRADALRDALADALQLGAPEVVLLEEEDLATGVVQAAGLRAARLGERPPRIELRFGGLLPGGATL